MPLRRAFRLPARFWKPFASSNPANTPLFAEVEPFSQLNSAWGSGGSQSRMWDRISSGVPMGIRSRAYPPPTHRTISAMSPCQLQSFNPFARAAAPANHSAPNRRAFLLQ
jgi:hypothetical protein